MKEINCNTPTNIKHFQEAKKSGLELLNYGKDENYRIYKFIKCGHQQEIDLRKVRAQKGFKCRECFEKILKDEALKIGLIYIGNDKKKGYKKKVKKVWSHDGNLMRFKQTQI